jgi:hypothetical protein
MTNEYDISLATPHDVSGIIALQEPNLPANGGTLSVRQPAERLIAAWNERQANRMPMLFSPTIGAAITACYLFLWVRCPACRTTNAIDLRTLDRHRDAAVTSLIPALSCRSCRPNAPFAELVRLFLLARRRCPVFIIITR